MFPEWEWMAAFNSGMPFNAAHAHPGPLPEIDGTGDVWGHFERT